MKLHADHRTVFETEYGVLTRKVAYFEAEADAQNYAQANTRIAELEARALAAEKKASEAVDIGAKLLADNVNLGKTAEAAEADAARLREKFRAVCIELHVQKHYSVSDVRWEDCENCTEFRALLPEYVDEQPAAEESEGE